VLPAVSQASTINQLLPFLRFTWLRQNCPVQGCCNSSSSAGIEVFIKAEKISCLRNISPSGENMESLYLKTFKSFTNFS
jgi:hypothetical protein